MPYKDLFCLPPHTEHALKERARRHQLCLHQDLRYTLQRFRRRRRLPCQALRFATKRRYFQTKP